ncbi:ankyrin repeat protein [Colletotrichum karsti]|uniref:Ankyrin repeat protein n=1 Tax=Colletotrichum karsti TaxID=1095194 RepID=A0A9P6LG22_9PEZI|nr:ankyrin repeat protein [Colletotrichum karsti]KAF9874739.1 ankyrin repeat protein [Colletotrichum karsti]
MASSQALDSPDHYTVAWIAALSIERAAAEAMLDEEHATPAGFIKHHTDKNVYTWGRIGQHNVVVASLPAGVYGTTSAATTALSLLASLPSIRVGLLVGIGGGIARPDEGQDIRLGDIVVSQPDGTTGGVCQYDLFKAKHGNKRERKGFLRQPPTVLLSALASIQARHKREDSKVTDFVREMLEKYPKMGRRSRKDPGFAYQGTENDRLFKALYDHVPGPGCQDCDAAGEVQRDARDSTDPEIHYGIIASGNTLIKDATARDQIVADVGEDCLCFEMEAAGLMNQFPCLVIRGICDYADSHKNDQWQQYASATAAAYGKELLSYVPVAEVRDTKRALDVLESVDHKLDHLEQTTFETKAAVVCIASERHADKIASWLQPPDPSTNANQARKLRHEGTCMWFLEHPAFKSWSTGPRRYSWLHGLAGCGKTVLSTTILDHLASDEDRVVLSFFFDFSDTRKQNLDGMLRSLAFQLYQSTTTGTSRLDDLFKNHDNGRCQPATKAISGVVCEMLAASTGVCVVLDALDESTTRRELLKWLEDVAARPDLGHVQLLCTARPEPEFLVRFDRMMGKESCISLDREAVNTDIRAYVAGQLAARWEFQQKHLSQDLIEQIAKKVGGGADGMFRWAACQVNSLAECKSPRMIRDALQHLPKDLEETYERMLSNIPKRDKDNAIRLLHFLVHTPRPLVVNEAIEILATDIRTQQPGFDKESRVFGESEVLGHCPSLMSIVEVTERMHYSGGGFLELEPKKQLHLAHFSVKEYLRSLEWFGPSVSGVTITKTCLTYLRGVSGNHKTIVGDYPFAKLAAEIWTSHAALSQSCEEVFQASLAFIKEEETFQRWGHLHQADWQSPGDPSPPQGSRFYYACLGGLTRVAQELMRWGVDVNAEGGYCNNALQAASFGGHYDVVKILLDEGADAHKKGGKYGNALQAASHRGHIGVVNLLLDKGVDMNSRCGEYGNALQAASYRGHITIVKLLLGQGANVNALGGLHGTALSAASKQGHIDVWKLLVAKGADICARGGRWGNALQAASTFGHIDIVKLLVEMRMDVNTPGDDYHHTALSAASNGGYTDIVELLLAHEADVTAGNALWFASENGHRKIVERLLKGGAEVNRTYSDGTPLYIASRHGHAETVKLLLKWGADANTRSGYFGGALPVASQNGHDNVVKALLDAGADPNAQGRQYDSPLQIALCEGRIGIARLLLDKGANANTPSNDGYDNALRKASIHGWGDMVKLLLDEIGADVNAQGGNALQTASSNGHADIVKLLLDKRADVNAQGGEYGNALRAATENGRFEVVKILLDSGAIIGDSMCAAIKGNHDDIVKLLLERGADVNARSGQYASTSDFYSFWAQKETHNDTNATALEMALSRGYFGIAELLLGQGANVEANAVRAAASHSRIDIVKLLLERRAVDGDLDDALRAAVSSGHLGMTKLLLEKGASVKANAVQAAASHGRTDIMKLLLEKRAVNDDLDDALRAAASSGHLGIAELLLERGANVKANAIQAAASYGCIDIMELLLEKGVELNPQDGDFDNALQAAASSSHFGIAKLLLEKGAYVSGDAIRAAAARGNGNIVELLLEKRMNLHARNGELDDALRAAVSSGHSHVVELLLKNGADANVHVDMYGDALQTASCDGKFDIAKLLLQGGAKIKAEGGFYGNALEAALSNCHWSIAELLFKRGASIQGGDGYSALRTALEDGEANIVELLLENGSFLGAEGGNYWPLLRTASEKGDTGIVKLVLEKLTDFDAESGNLNDALRAAHNKGFGDIVKMLLKKVADTTTEGNGFGFALEIASERGHSDIVRLLLEKGSDLGAQSAELDKALEAAHKKGYSDIVEMLEERGATRS